MNVLVFMIPVSILMGLAGLVAFIWALKTRQYEDLDGAASRILFEEENCPAKGSEASPLEPPEHKRAPKTPEP